MNLVALVGPVAPQEFGDQVRIGGDVREVGGGERGAVVVAAEADMVDAGLMPRRGSTALLDGDSDEAIGVGLSLEPAGGSEQPTEVVALFDLQDA